MMDKTLAKCGICGEAYEGKSSILAVYGPGGKHLHRLNDQPLVDAMYICPRCRLKIDYTFKRSEERSKK